MSDADSRLNDAADRAEAGADIIEQVANGGDAVEVPTASGPRPSLAKWFADRYAEFYAWAALILADCLSALSLTQSARDAAMLNAGLYVDVATGLVATSDGEFFSVPSVDPHEYVILYKNNSGVAVEQGRYPSAQAAVDAVTASAVAIAQAERAEAEADRAENSANIAAAAVSGSVNTFFAADKVEADALAVGLGDGATVITDRDGTAGGVQTRRVVTSGVLGSPVNELDSGQILHSMTGGAEKPLVDYLTGQTLAVEGFRTTGLSDSNTIIAALTYIQDNISPTACRLTFENGRVYTIDRAAKLGTIDNLTIDLNGATLKRRNASELKAPLKVGIGVGGSYLQFDSIPDNWEVGDKLSAYTSSADADTSKNEVTIVSIGGGRTNVSTTGGFGTFAGFTTTISAGTTIAKNFRMFVGNSSEGVNRRITNNVTICNGTIDGNRANQENRSWYFGGEIGIMGHNCSVKNCIIKETSNECIVGHGIRVADNEFYNLSGSAFHTSMHDDSLSESSGSWFINNNVRNVCLAGNTANGHSEGAVTFSWGAGNLIVSGNHFHTGTESVLGAFGPSNEATNPDRWLIVTNNICYNFKRIFDAVVTPAVGIVVTGNTFRLCGGSETVMGTIAAQPLCQVSNNVYSDVTYGITTGYSRLHESSLFLGNFGTRSLSTALKLVVGDDLPAEDLNRLGITNALWVGDSTKQVNYTGAAGTAATVYYSGAGFQKFATTWYAADGMYSFNGNTTPPQIVRLSNCKLRLDSSATTTPVYADNAAATSGGLLAGDVYRTSTGVLMVRY